MPYFGQQSEKFKTGLLFLLSKYFKNVHFNIVLINSFKVGSSFHIKIGFLRQCVLFSYINLVVHDVHLSMLGPLHVLYTRESLSMLEGVSELVLFCLVSFFLTILWLGLTLSRVGSQSL